MFDIGHLPSSQSAKCGLFLVGKDICLRMSDCSKHSSRYKCAYFQPQRPRLISRKSLGWLCCSCWWESGFRGYNLRYFQLYPTVSSRTKFTKDLNTTYLFCEVNGSSPFDEFSTGFKVTFQSGYIQRSKTVLHTLKYWNQTNIIGNVAGCNLRTHFRTN